MADKAFNTALTATIDNAATTGTLTVVDIREVFKQQHPTEYQTWLVEMGDIGLDRAIASRVRAGTAATIAALQQNGPFQLPLGIPMPPAIVMVPQPAGGDELVKSSISCTLPEWDLILQKKANQITADTTAYAGNVQLRQYAYSRCISKGMNPDTTPLGQILI